MQIKNIALSDVQLKADSDVDSESLAEIDAVVAWTDVIDAQSDMFMPGSFGQQDVLLGAWGHGTVTSSSMPLGYGEITESEGDSAVRLRATILPTPQGEHIVKLLKAEGKTKRRIVEWSITSRFTDYSWASDDDGRDYLKVKKAEAIEVAPVLRGAQPNTRTLALKSESDSDLVEMIATAAATAAVRAMREFQNESSDPGPEPEPVDANESSDLEARRAAFKEIVSQLGEE